MPADSYDQENTRAAADSASAKRPYIGIYFECCGVYARIYRRPEDKMYIGRCPRCLRQVQARVGPEGVNSRIFRAK